MSKMKPKAQVAIEFVIITSAVLFFFTAFFVAINENISAKTRQENDILIKELALAIKDEINLASGSGEGYYREFKIPQRVGSKKYSLSIEGELIYIKTDDNKNAIAMPILNITGQPVKGANIIKKQNGTVYLN